MGVRAHPVLCVRHAHIVQALRRRLSYTPTPLHMQVAYVTIAGKWVKGAALTDGSATWGQRAAGAGYAQVIDPSSPTTDSTPPPHTYAAPRCSAVLLPQIYVSLPLLSHSGCAAAGVRQGGSLGRRHHPRGVRPPQR